MNKISLLVILSILVGGCKPGIPENVIKPDKMQKILVDIHLVDGYLSTIGKQDSAKIISAKYYRAVYKKYGIDSLSYNKSLDYYYKHPDVFVEIYNEVTAQLGKQKHSVEQEAKKEADEQAKKIKSVK